MYELSDFAADKLARTVFFAPMLSIAKKTKHALDCADALFSSFDKTGEAFFLVIASAFLGRIENDLCYRGGTDEQIVAVMDKNLYAKLKIEELKGTNEALKRSFGRFGEEAELNLFKSNLEKRVKAISGRRSELLKNPAYKAILDKYI